jgi:hypothetical protein
MIMLGVVVAVLKVKMEDRICTSRPKSPSTPLTSHLGRFDLIEALLHGDEIYWSIQNFTVGSLKRRRHRILDCQGVPTVAQVNCLRGMGPGTWEQNSPDVRLFQS